MEEKYSGALAVLGGISVVVIGLVLTIHGTVGWSEANASWVQAWGSLLGLGIAIGVPWWMQRREIHRRRAEDHERAVVVAITLDLDIGQMRDCLTLFGEAIEMHKENRKTLVLEDIDATFAAMVVPTDEQIRQIQTVDPVASYALARGTTRFRQIGRLINFFARKPDDRRRAWTVQNMYESIHPALADLIEAHLRIKVVAGEVPEFMDANGYPKPSVSVPKP